MLKCVFFFFKKKNTHSLLLESTHVFVYVILNLNLFFLKCTRKCKLNSKSSRVFFLKSYPVWIYVNQMISLSEMLRGTGISKQWEVLSQKLKKTVQQRAVATTAPLLQKVSLLKCIAEAQQLVQRRTEGLLLSILGKDFEGEYLISTSTTRAL